MAEEKSRKNLGKQPPKIKLNGNGNGIAAGGAPAVPEGQKSETTRIELERAKLPTGGTPLHERAKKSTTRIQTPVAPGMTAIPEEAAEEAAKKATVRIDTETGVLPVNEEDIVSATKKATVRIDTATGMVPLPEEDKGLVAKKSTVKIDPATGIVPIPEGEQPADEKKSTVRIEGSGMGLPKGAAAAKRGTIRLETPEGMKAPSQADLDEAAKKATVRIDTAIGMSALTDEDRNEAAKKATVRVQIDEDRAKGDTALISSAQEAKKRTARINLNEVLEEEDDIFKRRTALLDSSQFQGTTDAPGAPRTIRIKRPDQVPPTAVVAQPPATAAVAPAPEIEPVAEARKSETARIDLPPEATDQPPTRRKTIRIKRPGAGGITSKPMIISQTSQIEEEPVSLPETGGEEEPGVVFSLLALAAVLVVIALVSIQGMTLSATGAF